MTATRLDPLTEPELQHLHDAALEVMHDPGARIMTEQARELLVRNGAVQEGEDLVRIPAELVSRALDTARATSTWVPA